MLDKFFRILFPDIWRFSDDDAATVAKDGDNSEVELFALFVRGVFVKVSAFW